MLTNQGKTSFPKNKGENLGLYPAVLLISWTCQVAALLGLRMLGK